jgi:hypothetical protein
VVPVVAVHNILIHNHQQMVQVQPELQVKDMQAVLRPRVVDLMDQHQAVAEVVPADQEVRVFLLLKVVMVV